MFEQDIHVRTISSFRPFCSSGVRTFSSSLYYYICSAVCFIAGTFLGAHMLLNQRYSFTSKCLVLYDDKKAKFGCKSFFHQSHKLKMALFKQAQNCSNTRILFEQFEFRAFQIEFEKVRSSTSALVTFDIEASVKRQGLGVSLLKARNQTSRYRSES